MKLNLVTGKNYLSNQPLALYKLYRNITSGKAHVVKSDYEYTPIQVNNIINGLCQGAPVPPLAGKRNVDGTTTYYFTVIHQILLDFFEGIIDFAGVPYQAFEDRGFYEAIEFDTYVGGPNCDLGPYFALNPNYIKDFA